MMPITGTQTYPWPTILHHYVEQVAKGDLEYQPRRTRRQYHGEEVSVWYGRVHVNDIDGWVDNFRVQAYLRRWKARQLHPERQASNDDIYDIVIEADREEQTQKKPFHIERMANNIIRNGIQEPIVIYVNSTGQGTLWDGNRRFFGTKHIMKEPKYQAYRDKAQWIPAFVITPTGDPAFDQKIQHCVLTELNFVEKDHIPWPAYVKAEQIYFNYQHQMGVDPTDPVLSREVKKQLSEDYGLKGWRVADRWIKMYELAEQFKEYQEEEHQRDSTDVDLVIQDKFEYFDELSKPGVWGFLKEEPDARDEVFDWLWDGKFQAFPDVRSIPKIFSEPVALRVARQDDVNSVRRAIDTLIANDPIRVKDKEAANEKIAKFAEWLDSFKREDYKQLERTTLERLRGILMDVTAILEGLLSVHQDSSDKDLYE
jgi:hypothetical protein